MRNAALVISVVVLSVAGCRATPPPATPTPMPMINVDDMMGLFPQQTVFVAARDHVAAITLLNHFTRYRISTEGVAQVTADTTGQRLYLLDSGTPGTYRLRVFDVPTGSERGVQSGIAGLAADRRVLSAASDGRVLVLKSDTSHAWVEAYEGLSLRLLGSVMDKPGCGDRLLTSGSRVAIVCRATGEIVVDDLRGHRAPIDGVMPGLVAAAMADDGTLYVATADRQLGIVAAHATKLASFAWPGEWAGAILADALAVVPGGGPVVIAQRTDNGSSLRVFDIHNLAQRQSFRLAGAPRGGILAMWPFAYYSVDTTIRHVDMTSGVLETMAEVGDEAVPGAVVNG
jgi:hypothetical protein